MLARDAHKFAGWRMYVDHLSPSARKAADGLPRAVRDLGGRIVESFWDPSVPADEAKGYGQGAVVGRAKPVPFIRDLIENDPEIVEASISATATGVRPVVRNGERVWLVEGISDRGSVDWVTEAGAGGRVAPLIEAAYEQEEEVERVLLEAMSDDEVRKYLAESRPALINNPAAGGANPALGGTKSDPAEGGSVSEITAEALQEALSENPDVLTVVLSESAVLRGFIDSLVEGRVEERVEGIMESAREEGQRIVALRDLRDEAHKLIRESRLPESWQRGLAQKFELVEGRPTEALNVLDQTDDDGNVVKTAGQRLRESVEVEISHERDRLAEVAPTRVRNQGPSSPEGGEGEGEHKAADTGWGRFLTEAGIDPDTAYAD